MLSDEFDTLAANYAAFDDDGCIVGSIRVVPDSPIGLPLEQCHSLDGFRSGKRLVELCRLAVAPDLRCSRLAALLMKAGYQCACRRDATHIVLDTYIDNRRKTHLPYFRMGFEQLCEPYQDPSYQWTLPVVPLALDRRVAESELPIKMPTLYRFFTSPDPMIDHGTEAAT